jgi:hypothetical protein
MSVRKGVVTGALAALAGAGGWWYRGMLRSVFVRMLIPYLKGDPGLERGLGVRFHLAPPPWLQVTLVGNIGEVLSDIIGQPVEAVAYSRFAGFPGGRTYSDFMNPDSPYYQVWLGAYLVFDGPGVQRFGFDADGQPDAQAALDVLEADQRHVYRGAGCDRQFDDGRRVRQEGEFTFSEVEEQGTTWWRMAGQADTWSVYHLGESPQGRWYHPWLYGVVPPDAGHAVDEWHPLTYRSEFWTRYDADRQASCSKFFVYPASYQDRGGNVVTRGIQIVPELRRLLGAIEFIKR